MNRSFARGAVALVAFCTAFTAAGQTIVNAPECARPFTINALTDTPDFQQFYGMDVAVRANGKPLFACYGRSTQTDPLDIAPEGLWVHSCPDAACSPGTTRKLLTTTFLVGRPQIHIRANGRPLIFNGAQDALHVFDCRDANCRDGENRPLQLPLSATANYDFVLLERDRKPIVIFTDRNVRAIRLLECLDADCADAAPARTLVQLGPDDSVSIAAVLAPGDRPIVHYSGFVLGGNQPDGFTRLATCDDFACANPATRELGAATFVTSGALRADRRAIFTESYNTPTGTAYRLRDCANAACSDDTLRPFFNTRVRQVVADDDGKLWFGMDGLAWGYVTCATDDCTQAGGRFLGFSNPPGIVVQLAARIAELPVIGVLDYEQNRLSAAVCSADAVFGNEAEPRLDLAPVD